MSSSIVSQPTLPRNGQSSIEATTFIVPGQLKLNITQAWSLRASEAIQTLIDFRSNVHRWQAQGQVSDKEFVAEVQRLADAGLEDWADDLISLAVVATCGGR